MANEDEIRRYQVDRGALPDNYPTHFQSNEFWEALGRTIATYGFLEEVLAKAIFALTGTREYSEEEIEAEYKKWIRKLERSVSDPLGNLIDTYNKAVKEHPEATITNFDELIKDLRKAARMRNVYAHGSWRIPDASGKSKMFYVDRKMNVFDSAIDTTYLKQAQMHVAELACSVINTVTTMGWQFPGSSGSGKSIA